MQLTPVQDQAIAARMALIVGGATFDRLFAGVRYDDVDGDILYVYAKDEEAVIPSDRATASAERIIARSIGVPEPNSTATRRIFAAVSLSTLSHLPPIAGSKDQKPVRLPPGRARFVTRPLSMGLCEASSAGFRTCTGRRSNGWPAR